MAKKNINKRPTLSNVRTLVRSRRLNGADVAVCRRRRRRRRSDITRGPRQLREDGQRTVLLKWSKYFD